MYTTLCVYNQIQNLIISTKVTILVTFYYMHVHYILEEYAFCGQKLLKYDYLTQIGRHLHQQQTMVGVPQMTSLIRQ